MGSTIGVPMGVGMLMLMVMITTFFFLATAFVMRMCMRRAISMLVSMRVRVIMVVIAAVILAAAWRMIMRMRLAIRVGMCMGMVVSSHDNLLRWLSNMQRTIRCATIIPRGWFLCNQYITNAVRSLMIVAVTTTAMGMMTMPFSATTALFLAAAVIGGAMIGMVCPPAIMAVVPGRRRNTMISLWHHCAIPPMRTVHVVGLIYRTLVCTPEQATGLMRQQIGYGHFGRMKIIGNVGESVGAHHRQHDLFVYRKRQNNLSFANNSRPVLVAQRMTNLDAQTHQFRLILFEEFLEFDNKHIAQVDLGDSHRVAGFIECQHVPILHECITGQRNRNVIALF